MRTLHQKLGVALTVLLTACNSSAPPAGQEKSPGAMRPQAALTVSVVEARKQSTAASIPASGEVAPWQESSVGLEIGGHRIATVLVGVGDSVDKGQVLAQLNTDSLVVELSSAQAALAEAHASLEQAKATLERSRKLEMAGGVSAQDLTLQQTAVNTAKARVQLQEAQVARAQLNFQRATLVAPDMGIISARNAAEGAIAQAGSELFKLIRHGRLEWRAEVSAARIHMVKTGQRVVLRASDGEKVYGSVRQVAPSLSSSSRTGIVYVDLLDAPQLKAGMHLSGEINGDEQEILVLPLAAISMRDGRAYVFSIKDSKAQIHEVAVGRTLGDEVEILTGLQAGVSVVNQGAGFLKAGDTVKVVGLGAK